MSTLEQISIFLPIQIPKPNVLKMNSTGIADAGMGVAAEEEGCSPITYFRGDFHQRSCIF